jgi:hypothetical protein
MLLVSKKRNNFTYFHTNVLFFQIIDTACDEGRRQGETKATIKFTSASGATIVSFLNKFVKIIKCYTV